MTRGGYRSLLAALALLGVLGLAVAAPTRGELGLVEATPCEEFVRAPYAGEVRLTGCRLSFGGSEVYLGDTGAPSIRWMEPEEPVRLYALLMAEMSPGEVERWHERHSELGTSAVDIEASVKIESYDSFDQYQLAAPGRPPRLRSAGVVLALLSLLALLALVRAQRRWSRTRAALRGEGTAPLTF